MAGHDRKATRLPRGVQELPRVRRGRKFRARIRLGKRGEVHLGLYESPWLAAFAYNVAAQAVGRSTEPPNAIPHEQQPGVDRMRAITDRVLRRLEPERPIPPGPARPPGVDETVTFHEIVVVGFWRGQAAQGGEGRGDALDAAAARLVESTEVVFWPGRAGFPKADEVLVELLSRRLDASFRRADLTREVLDDDGDDPVLVARWLVHPDRLPGGRGFAAEVRHLYREFFDASDPGDDGPAPVWAEVLGLTPPFDPARIRAAFRARSRQAHPDAGGSEAEFVRLKAAYEAALRACGESDD